MPEDLRDFRKGCAVTDHPGCQAVTEDVSGVPSGAGLSGTCESLPDHTTHRGRAGQPHVRSDCAEEDSTRAGGPSASLEVVRQCLSHICHQGQAVHVPSLSAHDDFTGAPVDVIEFEGGDFTGPQTQPRKQEQNRVVPPP